MSRLRYVLEYDGATYKGRDVTGILENLCLRYLGVAQLGPIGAPKLELIRAQAHALRARVKILITREPRNARKNQSRYIQKLISRGLPAPVRRRRERPAPMGRGGRGVMAGANPAIGYVTPQMLENLVPAATPPPGWHTRAQVILETPPRATVDFFGEPRYEP